MNEQKLPKVSVGMPVYNGEKLISGAISSILSQSFTDFELIIADNCSTDRTKSICQDYRSNDNRISYYRHNINKGSLFNFRFVVDKSKGEYFMWAAYDDRWSPFFIEKCLKIIGNNGSAFTGFTMRYFDTKKSQKVRNPNLNNLNSVYQNAWNYLKVPNPCLYYGLHRKKDALRLTKEKVFDWYDVYFCFYQIINNGYSITKEKHFINGVPDPENINKPEFPSSDRLFIYYPFLKNCFKIICLGKKLDFAEKIKLSCYLLKLVMNNFIILENNHRPIQTKIMNL